MKKWLSSTILAATVTLAPISALISSVHAASVTIYVNGQKQTYDQPPVVVNYRTLVPMRGVFESLGASIEWNQDTQTVTGKKGDTTITLQIGSNVAYKNGYAVKLDVAAYTINDRTMVPLRFVSESLGADVGFDDATQTATVTTNNVGQKLSVQDIVKQNDAKIVKIETNLGQGSGIAVKDGLFLTNYHVMKDATTAKIKTFDGKEYIIQGLAAYDASLDLALIKTSQKPNIQPVTIGDPSGLQKGEHVTAIGSPLGLQNTVSEGVVSNFLTQNGVKQIQISVPINHGSSGGALFNDKGEVVGVTSSGFEGGGDLNFAISIDQLSRWNNILAQSYESISASFPQVQPKPGTSLPDVKSYLDQHYSSIPTSKGSFGISNWIVQDTTNFVMINATINSSDFGNFLTNYYTIEPELNAWTSQLGSKIDELLPGKNVSLMIFYQDVYSFYPTGYQADEISATGDGKWIVTHWIINLNLSDKIRWTVRH